MKAKSRKNLFSNRREYWQKIRAPIQPEDEICRQIDSHEVSENDKYLLGRACVRNNYMRAYKQLSLLPEVNIIIEARVYNESLFNELSTANSKYVAMNDREEVAFKPREVLEWYNTGTTYVNTRKGVKPDWDDYFERVDIDSEISTTKLYLSNNLPSFVWNGMYLLICYVCYHGIEPACDRWLKYDIAYYCKYIQHGILTNLSFAKYCLTREDLMNDCRIVRSVINTLIMNDIVIDFEVMPYCIWHPRIPLKKTLQELVKKTPKLKILVGRVCAIAHYNDLYDSLDIPADEATYREAIDSGNTYIMDKLENMERKYYMVDDICFNRYFPDIPKDVGPIHVLSKVKVWYSRDRSRLDPDIKTPHLFNFANENTEAYDANPAIQGGLGIQEVTSVLNKHF